jgi:thiol-disulfide isomerase/thioredoxin
LRTRTKRLILALLLVQGVAFGTYRLVERSRGARGGAFSSERLSGEEIAPELALEAADGREVRVGGRGRPLVIHFWATWCPPCREELPALLEAAARSGVELLAVSVDDDWGAIRRFFGDGAAVPAAVVRARSPDAHTRYGARSLPDTFRVDARGRLVERFAGARDWRSPEAARALAR